MVVVSQTKVFESAFLPLNDWHYMLCLAVIVLIQHCGSFQFALKTCKVDICRTGVFESDSRKTTGILVFVIFSISYLNALHR